MKNTRFCKVRNVLSGVLQTTRDMWVSFINVRALSMPSSGETGNPRNSLLKVRFYRLFIFMHICRVTFAAEL